MPENDKLNPEELQSPKLATLPVDPTTLEEEENVMEGVENVVDSTEEDLDIKTYYKLSPTLYIKAVETEEVDAEGEKLEIFKVLNPETNVVEERELTDDEKKELFIAELKRSQKKFNPLSHPTKVVGKETITGSVLDRKKVIKEREIQTNVTVNKYGSAYKQKRKRRNKLAKTSRKANR